MTDRWKVRRRIGLEPDKRLSGPELAAEYHAINHDALEVFMAHSGEHREMLVRPLVNRRGVLERFASLPHYDEEPA